MPEMRCFAKLGVVRFRHDNWQVMIYRNSLIDIQRAKDIDDAAKTIEMVGIILEDGFTGQAYRYILFDISSTVLLVLLRTTLSFRSRFSSTLWMLILSARSFDSIIVSIRLNLISTDNIIAARAPISTIAASTITASAE